MYPHGHNLWLHKPQAGAVLLPMLWFLRSLLGRDFCPAFGKTMVISDLCHHSAEKPRLGQTRGTEFCSYPWGSSLEVRIKAK